MTEFDLVKFMDTLPVVSGMMAKHQIYGILYYLKDILDKGIEGEVVELGCNVGTTSIFIKKFIGMYTDRKYYVYDSWRGLPPKVSKDMNSHQTDNCNHCGQDTCRCPQYEEGACATSRETFERVFESFGLELPIINSGWFKEIPDDKYPEKICLAFYDGDFYTSIIDSFNKTYHKIQKGGVVIIDDISKGDLECHPLPGCERACIDFLRDKEESHRYTGYPNSKFEFDGSSHGGAIVFKQ